MCKNVAGTQMYAHTRTHTHTHTHARTVSLSLSALWCRQAEDFFGTDLPLWEKWIDIFDEHGALTHLADKIPHGTAECVLCR